MKEIRCGVAFFNSMPKWHSDGRFRSKKDLICFPAKKNATGAAILANQQHYRIFFLGNGEERENIFKWKGLGRHEVADFER